MLCNDLHINRILQRRFQRSKIILNMIFTYVNYILKDTSLKCPFYFLILVFLTPDLLLLSHNHFSFPSLLYLRIKKRKDTTPICRTLSFWYVIFLLRGLTMFNSDKKTYYLGIPFQEYSSLYSYAGRTSYWGTISSGILLFNIHPLALRFRFSCFTSS